MHPNYESFYFSKNTYCERALRIILGCNIVSCQFRIAKSVRGFISMENSQQILT